MTGLIDNVEYWRGRAEETRTIAESMDDDEASMNIMLGIAKDYDRMAERAEERLKHRKKSEELKR
jgi:hypothetical protein